MAQAPSPVDAAPALSIQLWNFSAKDPGPGGWQPLFERARAADAAGVDRLVVSEHVILGENLEAYGDPRLGGSAGGRQPTGPDGHWLDPIVLLSMLAASTSRVRLMTGILIAGLRRPANLAKTAATLDVLSGGRLDLGVGVGWQREEYEANGIPFERRGARLDRTLELCQRFWSEESVSHASEELRFEKIHCNPKPLQPCGVPLWISGTLNPAVLRRIGRFGSGWIPWGDDARDPAAAMPRVREALEAAGRGAAGFQATAALPAAGRGEELDLARCMEPVPRMREAGITDFRLMLSLPPERGPAEERLVPAVQAFRAAAGRSD